MAEQGTNRVAKPVAVEVHSAGSLLVAALSIMGFATLTALAAQVRVPLPWTPVPMTLQLLAVLLTGLSLAPTASAAAMALYVACGAAGLPVFSADCAGILGISGGYLVGFVVAAWVIARLRGRAEASAFRLVGAAIGGTFLLFTCGAFGLFVWAIGYGLDPVTTVASGSLPFVPKAMVEVGVAVSLVTATRGFRERWASRTR